MEKTKRAGKAAVTKNYAKQEGVALSKKDLNFREEVLGGSLWKVIWQVALPLCLYQCLGQVFSVMDSMIASHISSETVSAVSYIGQITSVIMAIGAGLAVGASLKVSEAYGQGNFELVQKRVSTLYAIAGIIGAIIALMLPFTDAILRLMQTPEELIAVGSGYFRLQLFGQIIFLFNNVYIAIERARGETKLIMGLNMIVILVKTTLNALFVFGLHGDVVMMSVATICSQGVLMLFALQRMLREKNIFCFSRKHVSFKREVAWPMISQSIPLAVERTMFSAGKLMVSFMSSGYGILTVGALGVSNNLGGFASAPQNGIQDGSASVISQNVGANKYQRAVKGFRVALVFDVIAGMAAYVLAMTFLPQITGMFSKNDVEFQHLIAKIFTFEAIGFVPLGINSAVMSLLYGLGKTKFSLFISMARIFIFRVPVLFLLQKFTNIGNIAVGVVMMVSNVAVALIAVGVAIVTLHKLKKREEAESDNLHL